MATVVAVVVAGLLCASQAALAQTAAQRVKQLYREAKLAYNKGQYALAADKLEAAIRADPNAPGVYRTLGLTYLAMKKCYLAVPYFRRYLKLKPKSRYIKRVRRIISRCVMIDPRVSTTAPVGQAELVLRVNKDGARVVVDDVTRGATPMGAVPLQPGKHKVTVALTGHVTWATVVEIARGQVLALKVVLKPDPNYRAPKSLLPAKVEYGTVEIIVPSYADINVDGQRIAVDADGRASVPAGKRRIEVSGRGLKRWVQTIEVRADKTTVIRPMLEQTKTANTLRLWAWGLTGAAAGLAVIGAIVGLVENRTYEQIRDYDRQGGTRRELENLVEKRRSQALATHLLFGLAAAAATAGLVMFTITPEIERSGGLRGITVSSRFTF